MYELLRYGVKVWLIDWKQPLNNHFAIAEDVTVNAGEMQNSAKASSKRPDVVPHLNGMARGCRS